MSHFAVAGRLPACLRFNQRALQRKPLAVLAALAASALLCGPAMAGNPLVAVTVTAIPTTVTFSRPALTRPLTTYAAYEISVANNSTNTLNNVRFTGATSVQLGSPVARSAPFRESIGAACSATDATLTSITCAIGQLRGGGGSIKFIAIFDSPAIVDVLKPCPAASCDQINFATRTFYSEGGNDSGGAAHTDTTDLSVSTELGTPTTTVVRSFVPSGGGQFFTGIDGVPRAGSPGSPADLWTTTVSVPSLADKGAEVMESVNLEACSSDVTACFFSDVTIPGTFAGLVITLRRDASTIAKGAKIANAAIFYRHLSTGTFAAVQACSITGGPQPGVPCIAARTEYTKRNAPTPELIGDWEFVIHAVDNGRFAG